MLETDPIAVERTPDQPDASKHGGAATPGAPGGFPLFSDTPFLACYHQQRKARWYRRLHPSCLPPIRLWDETDDEHQPAPDLLAIAHD